MAKIYGGSLQFLSWCKWNILHSPNKKGKHPVVWQLTDWEIPCTIWKYIEWFSLQSESISRRLKTCNHVYSAHEWPSTIIEFVKKSPMALLGKSSFFIIEPLTNMSSIWMSSGCHSAVDRFSAFLRLYTVPVLCCLVSACWWLGPRQYFHIIIADGPCWRTVLLPYSWLMRWLWSPGILWCSLSHISRDDCNVDLLRNFVGWMYLSRG